MNEAGARWLRFLRQYGPVPRNDNMYDEAIQRSARRAGLHPVLFEHPLRRQVVDCVIGPSHPRSVILTGTAGDGKTHLCRLVWDAVGGDQQAWESSEPYLSMPLPGTGRSLHLIRDLSAWVPQRDMAWDPAKHTLLLEFCRLLTSCEPGDLFVIAANDGQLIETWRRLDDTPAVIRVREILETLLVEDRHEETGVPLRLFNLSRCSSVELLNATLNAFLSHEGWQECLSGTADEFSVFGPRCPIRHNYELLQSSLVQKRLRQLFALCDHNELHVPIRQLLLLLANAVLGHPGVKDRLMVPADVPRIIRAGTVSQASLYSNLFGGNLTDVRREGITVFSYLDRFRIGYETSNRVDNILIFGHADDALRPYFDALLGADTWYGADDAYRAAQRSYVEDAGEDETKSEEFLGQLVTQRRGLFFKIPEDEEHELPVWDLTVFQFAGEYLERVVRALKEARRVERPILARIVRGLNRIFVGMLVDGDRELLLATSFSYSHAPVSRLLEERISVTPRLGERVDIVLPEGGSVPLLRVTLCDTISCSLPLHLTRYEFLSRVAEGALPSSFSRECYEDILAFKGQLMAGVGRRRSAQGDDEGTALTFRLLNLDDAGNPVERAVEVVDAS